MAITQRINPSFVEGSSKWNLPTKLPAESRLEIHNTDDSDFPFEARLITVKECTETEAAAQNQFVKIILKNHTGNQSFALNLGQADHGTWYLKSLQARTDGAINTSEIRVNRDLVDQIQIAKKQGLEIAEEPQEGTPPRTTNCLTRIFVAFCTCLKQLLEKLRAWLRGPEVAQYTETT